jgi:hypothetical protein
MNIAEEEIKKSMKNRFRCFEHDKSRNDGDIFVSGFVASSVSRFIRVLSPLL